MPSRPFDKIHIRDLLVRCIVGLNPDEREKEQDVVFNLTLYADYRAACKSDRLQDTVDYKAIKVRTIEIAKTSGCGLLEKLAELVAEDCLRNPRIHKVSVTVDKPGALRFSRSVAIEITREQDGEPRG